MTAQTTEPLTDCPLTEPHTPGLVRSHRDGCRCPQTMAVHRLRLDQEAHRKRRIRAGKHIPDGYTDATDTRRHLSGLLRTGHRQRRISEATGVGEGTLWAIRNRTLTVIRTSTAQAILGFKGDPAATVRANNVPALATTRRLRALAALGHTCAAITALTPVPPGKDPVKFRAGRASTLTRLRGEDFTGVTPAIAADVAKAYDQLWNTPPTLDTRLQRSAYTKTIQLAQREGWLPPMYWDDDRLADPSYTPIIPTRTRQIR